TKIDGDLVKGTPVNTLGEALKGKIAGARVYSSNNTPGADPVIRIRGGSSIDGNNDPLILVDGVERAFSGINPNDIESMEVLKDAASASIYGARASNGVILVTTKKGSLAKGPQIVFDLQLGCSSPSRKWDFMNAREYISFLRPVISKAYANGIEHNAKTMLSGPNAYGT
ncbi:TonB-dependent receptor plug domain-containing protein, partial [Alistipes communis]|uniref:TonB-dependent receptor plug domain-containing protein n=1 Tax=Alistipes communis TaxID=2585118 RepID=UPI0024321104